MLYYIQGLYNNSHFRCVVILTINIINTMRYDKSLLWTKKLALAQLRQWLTDCY